MRKKLVAFRLSEETLKNLDALAKLNNWNRTETLEKIVSNFPQLLEEVNHLKKSIKKLQEENQRLLKELQEPWWKKILKKSCLDKKIFCIIFF